MKTIVFLLCSCMVACVHTDLYRTPHTCTRNYEYCVESYVGSRNEFCETHDDCSREHWLLLCQNDLRTCEGR